MKIVICDAKTGREKAYFIGAEDIIIVIPDNVNECETLGGSRGKASVFFPHDMSSEELCRLIQYDGVVEDPSADDGFSLAMPANDYDA
jgi:hypothetical protein